MKVVITTYIEEEYSKLIDDIAKNEDRTKSQVIRMLLIKQLEGEKWPKK